MRATETTLRRLIREAVLAEMGDMWSHGRVGDDRMGVVVNAENIDEVYFEGTPAECQMWIEERGLPAPEIIRRPDSILFKVLVSDISGPSLGDIEDWLGGAYVDEARLGDALQMWIDEVRPGSVITVVSQEEVDLDGELMTKDDIGYVYFG